MENCLSDNFMPENRSEKRWYVLRDLKRRNARRIAIDDLRDAGIEVFTPMTSVLTTIGGKKLRRDVPVIQDLLFAHEDKAVLDAYVNKMPNLQYRYCTGHTIDDPMTVRDIDMERFIRAIESTETPHYYLPGEITPDMLGRQIRIVGGMVDGLEGRLLTLRGSHRKRMVVEVAGLISVSIEVKPEYIQLL